MTSGLVTLLTDFGAGSVYVGQMHGALLAREPDVRIVDLAHDVPPGAVAAAAYLLGCSWRHFPAGSVHVAVVDPGVGSARRILAAEAHGHRFLAPEGGLLGALLETASEPVVRRVENPALWGPAVSSTFHGRDIFAPVAAYLAAGGRIEDVGPVAEAESALPGPDRDESGIAGHVLLADRFGNLITDVPGAWIAPLGSPGDLSIRVAEERIEGVHHTFSDVPRGSLLAYVGSGDRLEVAVHGGSAAQALGVSAGAVVRIERSTA